MEKITCRGTLCSVLVSKVIKSRRKFGGTSTSRLTWRDEKRVQCLVANSEGKGRVSRPKLSGEDNIKVEFSV
jgi:hypothetical protein